MTTHHRDNHQDKRKHNTAYTRKSVDFTNYVIALLENGEEAEETVQALRTAGFAQADIVLSPEAEDDAAHLQQNQGMDNSLAAPPTSGQKLLTEEGIDQEQYTEERARGHVAVRVQTKNDEQVATVREVLAMHHAYGIKHVGRWTRETLSDAPDSLDKSQSTAE